MVAILRRGKGLSAREEGHNSQWAAGSPRDLHREGDDPRADFRHCIQVRDVLEARDIGAERNPVNNEIFGRTVVDAGGIHSESRNVTFLDQQLG